jgi:hypothetical protein
VLLQAEPHSQRPVGVRHTLRRRVAKVILLTIAVIAVVNRVQLLFATVQQSYSSPAAGLGCPGCGPGLTPGCCGWMPPGPGGRAPAGVESRRANPGRPCQQHVNQRKREPPEVEVKPHLVAVHTLRDSLAAEDSRQAAAAASISVKQASSAQKHTMHRSR